MPLLKFTLSEEGVSALREALACLNKFSEEVSLEATKDKLVFTALNSSKSAYACFSFTTNRFFSRYQFEGAAQNRSKFFFVAPPNVTQALLSLFRARSGDPFHEHEKDTTIERCDVAVEDEAGKNSRFIVKIICRNGMTTKYRLPFEVSPPTHAKFNKVEATNKWTMASRTLRQLMDHFGPGIEFLDIHSEDDQTVNFTCFTEKVAQGDGELLCSRFPAASLRIFLQEVLKKPLHTSIAIERDEFEAFEVAEENLHIVISVKDFRAITQHAAPLSSGITAVYSTASRPMQLSYEGDGLKCEFLLMTVGGERGDSGQKAKKARANAKGPRPNQLEAATSRATSRALTPAQDAAPAGRSSTRPDPVPSLRPPVTRLSQRPPPPTFEDDSLFVPQDNDNQWDPVNLNEDEEEENARLEWNASAPQTSTAPNMRSVMAQQAASHGGFAGDEPDQTPAPSDFEPTQRISQVRKYGLFGD
ncbi:uncharacterized protein JN550_000448 [Neoarthrinium moseri]|uniref:uncharacterized protein n=1 Tax=Neoarthrinium moseri TaxID=1658444 RepID=UPI001FDDA419|nr:uncharacterized protein JN550_000448 [Neoarthrinium moseri]KAI1878266.1 hypothetical protein JN550_000448 [Neoarthrinium moseri]